MASDRGASRRGRREPRPRPSLEGDCCGKRPVPAMADGRLFSGAPQGALSIAKQNSRPLAILRSASALRFAPGAGPVRPPPFVAMKAAMGAADPTKGSTDDDRPRRRRLRAAARLISDRSRPRRTPALRLPSLPGRARPETAARGPRRRRRRRRHLRRPRRHIGRHPPRTRPRGPALVDRQSLPPRRRPHRARTRRQRAGAAASASANRMAPKSARSNWSASRPRGRR